MVVYHSKYISCPICGLSYHEVLERQGHSQYCKKYVRACVKFNTIIHHEECEFMKRKADMVLADKNSSVSEKAQAFEDIFKAYFCRSVRSSCFDIRHPVFKDYCGIILNQKSFDDYLKTFPEVRVLLLKKYDRKTGKLINSTIVKR